VLQTLADSIIQFGISKKQSLSHSNNLVHGYVQQVSLKLNILSSLAAVVDRIMVVGGQVGSALVLAIQ
jgi:hypothetical protein